MKEIIFEVREADEGGYNARALGHSIFTQGKDMEDLRAMVKDAVACHFDQNDPERPAIIRLHFVRDEVLTASKPLTIAPDPNSSAPCENLATASCVRPDPTSA